MSRGASAGTTDLSLIYRKEAMSPNCSRVAGVVLPPYPSLPKVLASHCSLGRLACPSHLAYSSCRDEKLDDVMFVSSEAEN